ncbi:MAG: PIG-L deacetylase family protein [Dehalococcoidia bacterium]
MSPRARRGKPKRALVIVAHPDDAEFLCAGSVARWCAEGWDVAYVLVTSGDKGTHDAKMTAASLKAIREDEQRAAARALGVTECVFLGVGDGFVEDTPELRGRLVREIRRFKPDVLVTWDPYRQGHNHRDHRLTGQAALDAAYPLSRSHLYYPEHLAEGLKPHRISEALLAGTDRANFHVDVTDYFQTKIKALMCHKSQIGRYGVKEVRKRVRDRMAEVGKEAGFKLAEAFHRIEWR